MASTWNVTVTGDRIDWPAIRDRIDLAAVATNLMGPAPGRRGERGRRLWWRCPFHEDGNPSFCIEPGKPWWRCYGCGEHGDAANLVMRINKVGFPEAVRIIADLSGIVAPSGGSPRPRPPASPAASKLEKTHGRPPEGPSGLPLADALALVTEAADRLWRPEGTTARDYLHGRGLTDETIRAARLGMVASVSIPTREGDRCYQARGVVIPWFEGDRLALVKIRQPEGAKPKYAEAFRDRPRIFPDPEAIEPGRPLVIAEGEFDALLLGQELHDLAAVVTLGSASSKPEPGIFADLMPAAPWFLALDGDEAGDKAASGWPPRAIRVRPPGAFKDWTKAAQAGVNLRRWWSDRLGGTDAPAPPSAKPKPSGIIDQPDPEPHRIFVVDSTGTAEPVEAAPPRGLGTGTLPEVIPPPSEGQAAPEPRARYWTAPNLADDDVAALDAILAWPIEDHTSWAELIESGRAHNAAILARRGKI
ncbi:MAG: CHC2 zinc finger domain-containing protein [Isosphaeraceae bacterium]